MPPSDIGAKVIMRPVASRPGRARAHGATTPWRLITDEGRIAQRAAELERLAATSGTRQARAPGRARASR